jgi:hypothetical protein
MTAKKNKKKSFIFWRSEKEFIPLLSKQKLILFNIYKITAQMSNKHQNGTAIAGRLNMICCCCMEMSVCITPRCAVKE